MMPQQRVAHFQLDARIDSLEAVVAVLEKDVAELWMYTLFAVLLLSLWMIAEIRPKRR